VKKGTEFKVFDFWSRFLSWKVSWLRYLLRLGFIDWILVLLCIVWILTWFFTWVLDTGKNHSHLSTIGNSTNIKWHECPVEKIDRQKLLQQKGCVIWITGLSGSGLSYLAPLNSCGFFFSNKKLGWLSTDRRPSLSDVNQQCLTSFLVLSKFL
jgi:hypothetical protein